MKQIVCIMAVVGLSFTTTAFSQSTDERIDAQRRMSNQKNEGPTESFDSNRTLGLDGLVFLARKSNLTERLKTTYGLQAAPEELVKSKILNQHQLGVNQEELSSILQEVFKTQ
jgi:hypothetical protein